VAIQKRDILLAQDKLLVPDEHAVLKFGHIRKKYLKKALYTLTPSKRPSGFGYINK
jgi:hypothetical protein